MADIKWTPNQEQAINAEGQILVSAAAGSGKTAVLVERVIRKITAEYPCDIDELLIVTFTRAAAQQMKDKISERLEKLISENPDNTHLKKQQILLDKALICTIDSFCSEVVKNNFHLIEDSGITLNYTIIDDSSLSVISREVIDEIAAERFSSGDKDFTSYTEMFTGSRDDANLYSITENIHKYIGAVPNSSQWLSDMIEMYEAESVEETEWGSIIFTRIADICSACSENINNALTLAGTDENVYAAVSQTLLSDKKHYEDIMLACTEKDWDTLASLFPYTFLNWSRAKKDMDLSVKNAAKALRDRAKSYNAKMESLIAGNNSEFREDMQLLLPAMRALADFQNEYEKRLFKKKTEIQSYEFSDISALAIRILTDENMEKSEVARDYSDKFKEIIVDEYQDTNSVQDLLFHLVSRDETNLFIVGDAKQSIYRFRQAMPEIFIGRRRNLPLYSGENKGCVLLKKNFRSRKEITSFVNYIFTILMSRKAGDIDYNKEEKLVPGSDCYDDNPSSVQLHVLTNDSEQCGEKIHDNYYEGLYLADKIKRMTENGEMITDGGVRRPVKYSDFCVLFRSMTGVDKYLRAFTDAGVPVFHRGEDDFYFRSEILLVMSLLKAIDNPMRDIDLLAVMYSGIFGFTADEITAVRADYPGGRLYNSVVKSAQNGNKKCELFLGKLAEYRTMSSVLAPSDFVRKLYDDTDLPVIVSAAADGANKKANLIMFLDKISDYEKNGYFSLTGLIRFIEKIKANNPKEKNAYIAGGDDKVNFMTVHASKGLEFPVVILANCERKGHTETDNILLNSRIGIGAKAKNTAINNIYKTVPYTAVSVLNNMADTAENLRVLYVALTRAKDRLIISGVAGPSSALPEKLTSLAEKYCSSGSVSPFEVLEMHTFFDWILSCALMHPCAAKLRSYADSDVFVKEEEEGSFEVFVPEYQTFDFSQKKESVSVLPDIELEKIFESRFSFEYKYKGIEKIAGKMSPSKLNAAETSIDYWEFGKPEFLEEKNISAAHRGTSVHRFMEKCRSFSNPDIDKELAFMLEKHFLTKEEADCVDRAKIKKFFASELAGRINISKEVYREYEIAYFENAGFFDPSLADVLKNEKIFVQGVIDCIFFENDKAVILDYKTDYCKSSYELVEKYRRQLELYKRAAEEIFDCEVKETYIYSFYLNKEIKIVL